MFDKDKFVKTAVGKVCSESFMTMLQSDALDKVFGGDNEIAVGTEFTAIGFDKGSGFMKPEDITDQEWSTMSKKEREDSGIYREWANVVTNKGTVSLRSIMGHARFDQESFWADVPDENKANDFDISKLFIPSIRHAKTWLLAGADNIIGKTFKCVAIKVEKRNNFENKFRAFEIVD